MAAVDKLLGAAVQSVKTSGLLESMARMGVVSAVNSDGTIDVSRAGDVFPSVRLLTGYASPTVGDSVQMVKTMGGWVCVGAYQASTPTPQWVSASLASGYTNSGNSNGTVQYRVFSLAGSTHVEWSGGVSWSTNGSPPNGGVICTVPTSARPLSRRSLGAAAGGDLVKIDCGTDGTIAIVQRASSTLTNWVSLNGLTYRID
jgi:hypothetical protein